MPRSRRLASAACAALLLMLSLPLALPPAAAAIVLPAGYANDLVLGGFSVPRDLAFLPSGELLVIENEGVVKVIESGSARTLLDITARVRVSAEQGFLGVAVDPDFPTRPYVYFHYTADESPGHVRLSRFTFLNASGPGPLGIDASSEVILIGDIPDNAFNHNGGTVRFGPDKRLYMSIGEDADPCGAQDLAALKGKILRLNVDDTADPSNRSTLVPADNPFAGAANDNTKLVFAYGLRNPFRFDIDMDTGVLYIGDVGQSSWEEVDESRGGENFGWPYFEGMHEMRNRTTQPCAADSAQALTLPIQEYGRGGSAAIILSSVYHGADYPNDSSFPPVFEGALIHHDFYTGELRALTYNATSGNWSLLPGVAATEFATGFSGIPAARVGPDGALYFVDAYGGTVRRLVHTPTPSITSAPTLPPGSVGVSYAFSFSARLGTLPYTWTVASGPPPPGLALNATTGQLGGTPTQAGTFAFQVRVTDNRTVSATQGVTVSIRAPLQVATTSLPPAYEDEPFEAPLAATGGALPYLWSVSGGSLPAGLSLQPSTGLIAGTPAETGAFNLTLQVADPEGRTATRAFTLTVTPALAVSTSALPPGEVFVAYGASVLASGGTPPYSWTLDGGVLPSGLAFSADGQITGTPAESGLFPLTLGAHDARGRSAVRTVDLAVAPPAGGSPFVAASFAPNATAQDAYQWNLTAAGGYPPFQWTVTSGALPPGLVLSPEGVVSGVPSQPGNYTFTVQAADAYNQTANATFTLTVLARPHALVLLPVGEAFALAGTAITPIEVHWTGQNVEAPLVWSAVGLPTGLSIDTAGNISGVPAQVGNFTVEVSVHDAAVAPATATIAFSMHIPRVEVNGRVVRTLQVGVAANELILTDAGTYPLVLSVVVGALPPGLALTDGGTLAGTPGQAGTFNFTVRATGPGAADNFDEAAYSVTVLPGEGSPPTPRVEGGLPLEWILLFVGLASVGAFIASRRQLRNDR